jgi:beta-lactam-binding protein with PASTA domain
VELNRTTVLLVVRALVVVVLGVAVSAGVTLAASSSVPATKPTPAVAKVVQPAPLVVPDVRRLAFVFAKSELEDAGFGWRVTGSVHGYPANAVLSQTPPPGARIVDSGAPAVTLTLAKTKGYPQAGEAEDVSPYGATRPLFAALAAR